MATFEDIKRANDTIQTTPIKGKNYAEVPQRIKAFRMLFPEGFIRTEMVSDKDGVCVFRAMVGTYLDDGSMRILATGTAYEKESSSFINKTSYIENCETSAVGRALGMLGLGIDTSVASYEEVQNAINNQSDQGRDDEFATAEQLAFLERHYTGDNLARLLEANNILRLQDIGKKKASELIASIRSRKK